MLPIKLKTIQLDEVNSTNSHLTKLAENKSLEEGTLVSTKKQLEGKGQTGNIWLSEDNKNILESLYLKPTFLPTEYMFSISKVVSIGIIEAFNKIKEGFCIKWPNDIYYNDKKIGGILVENQLMGNNISQSIIGIGLNINQREFNESLPNPISLLNICNSTFNLDMINEQVMHCIFKWYNALSEGDLHTIDRIYHRYLYRKNGYHTFKDEKGNFSAKIKKVASDGKLMLLTDENITKNFYFKEVEFVL